MARGAIVIGASTGIGKELARLLSRAGYELGLVARRADLLEKLADELPTQSYVSRIDVVQIEEAREKLRALIDRMGGVDLIIVNSGVSPVDPDWGEEAQVIAVNVAGFAAIANLAIDHFIERGRGHLVGISSIASLRAVGASTVYSASKAFVSRYLEGLRLKVDELGLDIAVTDIKPGYVETQMTEGRSGLFWMATVDEAARQIHAAIRKRKRHAYITRRWLLMEWVLKTVNYPLLSKLS